MFLVCFMNYDFTRLVPQISLLVFLSQWLFVLSVPITRQQKQLHCYILLEQDVENALKNHWWLGIMFTFQFELSDKSMNPFFQLSPLLGNVSYKGTKLLKGKTHMWECLLIIPATRWDNPFQKHVRKQKRFFEQRPFVLVEPERQTRWEMEKDSEILVFGHMQGNSNHYRWFLPGGHVTAWFWPFSFVGWVFSQQFFSALFCYLKALGVVGHFLSLQCK